MISIDCNHYTANSIGLAEGRGVGICTCQRDNTHDQIKSQQFHWNDFCRHLCVDICTLKPPEAAIQLEVCHRPKLKSSSE